MQGISGNAGQANARVYWYSMSTFGGGHVDADSNGDYNTGEVLADDTYRIGPAVPGYRFSPIFTQLDISGVDATAVNFTQAETFSAALNFTELTNDTFQRADESPLNPAVWAQYFGTDFLKILDNRCVINLFPTNVTQDSDAANIAIDWKGIVPDQWIEFEISDIDKAVFAVYLRTDAIVRNETVPCYRLAINASRDGVYGEDIAMPGWTLDKLDVTGGAIDFSWVEFQPQKFNVGDIFRFAVLGGDTGHIYVYLNNVLLWIAAIADSVGIAPVLTAGIPGFQLSSYAGLYDADPQKYTDVGVINFRGGSVAPSTPAATNWASRNRKFVNKN